ncbi:MAG: hypothetical protein Q3997_02200 [Propionibacteriaceae bacterium]|nr:hypothetical protein [Propionibacteriaceae bacterium]
MKRTLLDLVRVPWDALRLFGRHWPTLIAVCALGLALRHGFLWAAVLSTNLHPTAGALLLPLAPIAMMVAIVVMLYAVRPSLEGLGVIDQQDEVSIHRRIIAVLLPFLAVYASQGFLTEDRRSFFYEIVYNEYLVGEPFRPNLERLSVATGWVAIALVIVALVIRKLLIGFELTGKNGLWGSLAVYVEVLWMMLAAGLLTGLVKDLTGWVESRQAWRWWIGLRDTVHSYVGPVGDLLQATAGAIGKVFSSAGSLIVVPVAWLSIGALVYGTKLAEDAKPRRALPVEEAPVGRRERVMREARVRAKAAAMNVVSPVTDPVKTAWTAFRKIAVAGVGPMVMFCLVFVLAQQLTVGVAWAAHWIVGPQQDMLMIALEPYAIAVERLVYLTAMTVLLAAAVNRVVVSLQREPDVVGRAPGNS